MGAHIHMERTIINSSIRWNVFHVAIRTKRMVQIYGKENALNARAESRKVKDCLDQLRLIKLIRG